MGMPNGLLFYIARVGGLGETLAERPNVKNGECQEACPQKLPIPDLLKAVTSDMEGRFSIQNCGFSANS
jgi:predicted aldo/keto reductase-like oxidoreductase